MSILFGYVGPETILPIISTIAAVGGAFLFMGRWVLQFAKMCLGLAPPASEASSDDADRVDAQ